MFTGETNCFIGETALFTGETDQQEFLKSTSGRRKTNPWNQKQIAIARKARNPGVGRGGMRRAGPGRPPRGLNKATLIKVEEAHRVVEEAKATSGVYKLGKDTLWEYELLAREVIEKYRPREIEVPKSPDKPMNGNSARKTIRLAQSRR
jgi:hypothetical protein